MPTASGRTSTSPGPGSAGSGTSRTRIAPAASVTAASMRCYAVTGAVPSTCCAAATILSSLGSTNASSGSLYGIVASSAVTSTIGAFSDEKPCSATSAAITDAADA